MHLYTHLSTVQGVDYVAASVELEFVVGAIQRCHRVEIIICKPTLKNFFADMLLVSGFDVSVDPDLTQVLIDDSDEDECGKWVRNCQQTAAQIYLRHVSECK